MGDGENLMKVTHLNAQFPKEGKKKSRTPKQLVNALSDGVDFSSLGRDVKIASPEANDKNIFKNEQTGLTYILPGSNELKDIPLFETKEQAEDFIKLFPGRFMEDKRKAFLRSLQLDQKTSGYYDTLTREWKHAEGSGYLALTTPMTTGLESIRGHVFGMTREVGKGCRTVWIAGTKALPTLSVKQRSALTLHK